MRAYIDESVRVVTPGLYVLAAVTVPPRRADGIVELLRASLPPGQRRSHWRDDSGARRRTLVAQFAELELNATIVVARPMTSARQERARRLCLRRLLWELEQQGVLEALLESRGEQDQADRRVIAGCQRSGQLSGRWTYAFGSKSEPLLWLPDTVAGAASLALAQDQPEYLTGLGTGVNMTELGGIV
jgi:hypothetical protein